MSSPEIRGRRPMRMQVTRGETIDVAAWVEDEGAGAGPAELATRWDHVRGGPERLLGGPTSFGVLASLAVVALIATVVVMGREPVEQKPLEPTVADLRAVHPGVLASGVDVRGLERLGVGEVVETDGEGRARLRLDDGTTLVIDRDTRLTLEGGGIALSYGRVFVQAAVAARTTIRLGEGSGDPVAIGSAVDAAVERAKGGVTASVYAASGERTLRAGGREQTVRTGETASVRGSEVAVAPERSFDDWTGGMAAPWGARGAPRRAVGELWGRPEGGEAGEIGSPLTIRSHEVKAKIHREVAETELTTTFFNGGSTTVTGDFRMALPPGAIVGRFTTVRDGVRAEAAVALASRTESARVASREVLEWAGEGWVRGTLPRIEPGKTVTVVIGYVEWLPVVARPDGSGLLVQYRYPMVGDAVPPLIGEFSASVDARSSDPVSLAAGLGARVSGQTVELRRPDFRPTADLVVDVAIAPFATPARAYVAPPGAGTGLPLVRDDGGSTLVVRTEVPSASREDGITLALVVDASSSIEPALLEAERALVEAVLRGLGSRDRVVVLAADQSARPIGPATAGPVDEARRKATLAALAEVTPGGATDLGRALEAAADALPPDSPAALVIYIGDGWPTVGDADAPEIQARLARRRGGAPRVGAVAVGPIANRQGLAALVRGSGPLLEIADGTDAATVAVSLIAEALQPALASVELLGPGVERVYPRRARAVLAGSTVSAVGRVRGELPKEVVLRWRDARGAHEEKRALTLVDSPTQADVTRRWAAARIEEIAVTGKGREAATDVALRAGLLTPWTGWATRAPGEGGPVTYSASSLATRILDLAMGAESGFAAAFATPPGGAGALASVPHEALAGPEGADGEDAFEAAIAAAASRVLAEAHPSVRSCRDSRAALRPELGGRLDVAFELDGEGRAVEVRVHGADVDDEALDRCVRVVIEALRFPASGLEIRVDVRDAIELPPVRSSLGKRRCSPTSTLPLPLRRGVWRERLDRAPASAVYLEAKQGCELPTWTDKRTLLELVLVAQPSSLASVEVARQLARAGDDDAAGLLRREAVRRARSPEELRSVQRALVGDESYPAGVFRKRYLAATSDAARLGVVRRFLAIAPHDPRLRRRLMALLEAGGMKQELADEVRRARLDPFADASLLAEGASALRRIGDEAEARRAFGELAERAPRDPWARAFLGDRLRNEGWFDEATLAYAALEELVPDEPGAVLRQALAHAGAGRLDIAQRMLSRVARTGGRAGDARLGDLAGRLSLALLADARARPGLSVDEADRITTAALELPRPAEATLFLVRGPGGSLPLEVSLLRGAPTKLAGAKEPARDERAPEVAAEGIGLYALRLDGGDRADVSLRLRRPEELAPASPTKVRIDALVPDGPGKPPRIVSTLAELPISGKAVEIGWRDGAWATR